MPLRRDVLADLATYLEQHPHRHDPDAAPWPGRLPGNHRDDPDVLDFDRQFDPVTVYRYFFKTALERLGPPAVRWHDLRHSYASASASACAAADIDIRKVDGSRQRKRHRLHLYAPIQRRSRDRHGQARTALQIYSSANSSGVVPLDSLASSSNSPGTSKRLRST